MRLNRKKFKLIETYGTFLVDFLVIAVSYLLAHRLRILLPFGAKIGEDTAWFPVYVLCILGCMLYHLGFDRYEGFFRRGYFIEAEEVLKYNVFQFVFLSTCVYLFRLELDFSRLMLVYFVICDALLGYFARLLFKSFVRHFYKKGRGSEKILIVTDSNTLDTVEDQIRQDQGWSYEVVGVALVDQATEKDYIREKKESDVKLCDKIVAGRDNLLDAVRQMPIDLVFIHCRRGKESGESEVSTSMIEEWIQAFFVMGIPCYYCIQHLSLKIPVSGVGEFAQFPVICYNTKERDWRMSVVKRLADFIGGLLGMIITAVLFPFIAVAIKAEDPKGSVFFSQTRTGKNGRRFRMYKFRSMYADAEARKKELMAQNEVSGPMFKLQDDPRITKVGRFLRRTSLDELPQFWNILKGDMSLVGTRPPTVEEFEQYNDYYRRRMSITPGLTGLWQVSGRSDIKDFNEVVKLDLLYIDNWSIGQDVKILLQTVGVVLKGMGAK